METQCGEQPVSPREPVNVALKFIASFGEHGVCSSMIGSLTPTEEGKGLDLRKGRAINFHLGHIRLQLAIVPYGTDLSGFSSDTICHIISNKYI